MGGISGRRRWEPETRDQKTPTSTSVLEQIRLKALNREGALSDVEIASAVRASGNVMGAESSAEMVQNLSHDIHGLGVLEEFAKQTGVTDVLVDAHGQIWIDGTDGLKRTGSGFNTPGEVRALAVRFAAGAGRRLDEAQPFVDVSLGKYRIHAVLPPIAAGGTVISVRVKQQQFLDLASLIGPEDPGWLDVLKAIVQARLNILISGGTGAGKTTLLSALLAQTPANERIIVVEDSAELMPKHPHLISLQTRGQNVEGAGEIGLSDLVRQSLRMRPDRLVVGECRGAEIGDFLGAMNTGHEGAAGTVHANSVQAVPARLMAMGALAKMSPQATALQAASAFDVLIHVARNPHTGQRRPVQLGRLRLSSSGALKVQLIKEQDVPVRQSSALEWFRQRLLARGIPSPW